MSATTIAAVLLAASPSAPQQPSQDKTLKLTGAQQEVFAVLDRLDSLDTSKLPFIKVATGEWVQYGDRDPENTYGYGFLLGAKGRRFRVRFLDLTEREFEAKADKKTARHERVSFHPANIRAHVKEFAAGLQALETDPDSWHFYLSPSTPANPTASGALLARACARRGLGKEVECLWEALPDDQEIREEVAEALAVRLRLDFGNRALSFKDLHERHVLWMSEFGDHSRAKRVGEVQERLAKMLAEDAKRPPRRGAPTAADLVHDLRHEFVAPGEMVWSSSWRLEPTGPAPKEPSQTIPALRKLGFDAVPALIQGLGDPSFTRCVAYCSRHGGSFWNETVSDFASTLLQERSGLQFWTEPETQWREWYESVVKNGEEATLANLVVRANDTAVHAATRLLKLWPHRTDAVLAVVRKKGVEPRIRSSLVAALGEIDRPETVEFLIEELSKGPDIEAVVAAAGMLGRLGRREGLDFVMGEWSTAPQPAYVELLLTSGESKAVQAILDKIEDTNIRDAAWACVWAQSLEGFLERASAQQRSRIEHLVEDLVARMLRDEIRIGGTHWFNIGDRRVTLNDPSRAELAACTLVSFWPRVYSFDPNGSASARARDVLRVHNTWRARRGLPAIQTPPERSPAPQR